MYGGWIPRNHGGKKFSTYLTRLPALQSLVRVGSVKKLIFVSHAPILKNFWMEFLLGPTLYISVTFQTKTCIPMDNKPQTGKFYLMPIPNLVELVTKLGGSGGFWFVPDPVDQRISLSKHRPTSNGFWGVVMWFASGGTTPLISMPSSFSPKPCHTRKTDIFAQ